MEKIIIRKISVDSLINTLSFIKDKGFDYVDIEGHNNDIQDVVNFITYIQEPKKEKTNIVVNSLLTEDLINKLL